MNPPVTNYIWLENPPSCRWFPQQSPFLWYRLPWLAHPVGKAADCWQAKKLGDQKPLKLCHEDPQDFLKALGNSWRELAQKWADGDLTNRNTTEISGLWSLRAKKPCGFHLQMGRKPSKTASKDDKFGFRSSGTWSRFFLLRISYFCRVGSNFWGYTGALPKSITPLYEKCNACNNYATGVLLNDPCIKPQMEVWRNDNHIFLPFFLHLRPGVDDES